MTLQLTNDEIDILIEGLEYAKVSIKNDPGRSHQNRKQEYAKRDAITAKLEKARPQTP